MIEYIDILNKTTDLKDYQNISVAFNNHFAGFGPQSANTFLKLMDMPEINNGTKELEKEQQNYLFYNPQKYQTSIFDFTNIKDTK